MTLFSAVGARTAFVAGLLFAASGSALAAGSAAPLFKVVTAKDEVVIALPPATTRAIGGADPTHISQALRSRGELSVWHYAVRHGQDGTLEQAPLRKISLVGREILRVEPYTTPLRVVPPSD